MLGFIRHHAADAFINHIYPLIMKQRVNAVKKKDTINVVFLAVNVSMWRYQGIYELMAREERFNVSIVLTISTTYSKEQQAKDLESLRAYFFMKGIEYFDYDEKADTGFDMNRLNPDIIFYPQPYDGFSCALHDYKNFRSKLLCFVPYGIGQTEEAWFYNTQFHNLAWKLYYPFPVDLERSRKIAHNKGRNMVISGYTNFDLYLSPSATDVWKLKDNRLKRLIWAPHFSIGTKHTIYTHSNFLWMAEMMIKFAQQYENKLQIAFKPHPRLKSELYKHPEWGKVKTDEYYHKWEEMPNTFVETGDFIDLFKTSDAMIHDCSSFSIEYLFVNKPVAFVTRDLQSTFSDLPKFGQQAIKMHYIVKNEKEISAFIEDVVLAENDNMKAQRTDFFLTHLKPQSGLTTNEFIVNDIKGSLGI